MPFVIPSASIATEGLVFDGLDLAQGPSGVIMLDAFTPPIPDKRQEWVQAADSDGAILARVPLVSNSQATVKVDIAGISRDDANSAIGQIIDKLQEADRNPDGIPLVWTPSGSTPSLTFYVLSGKVTEMPVDWESGYMAYHPSVTFTLDCKPYGYGTPVTYTGSATAGPLVTIDLAGVPGTDPAEAILTVTESSSQSRRTVEWGAEQRYYNPSSPWSLVLDSDSLVTSGFAGTQTTLAGAYDPGASGNAIVMSTVLTSPQAMCGTGSQPHVGTFRVKARVNTGPGGATAYFRFAWRAGDGSYTTNDPAAVNTAAQMFMELDLGLITIPPATSGTQAWDGRVEAYADTADTLYVDYLMLIPVEAGYGKATASYAYTPGVVSSRDSFAGLGSGTALNTRTPDVGAAWVTGGVATDFAGSTTAETTTTQPRVARTTAAAEATPRVGAFGSAMTDQEVGVSTYATGDTLKARSHMAVARYVDASNYLRLQWRKVSASVHYLEIVKVIATVETTLVSSRVSVNPGTGLLHLRLIVFASGRAVGTAYTTSSTATVEAADSTLATAGTLASGKGGIGDQCLAVTGPGSARLYDDVMISIPSAEPIALYSGRDLEIRHDSAERESSSGGTWGRPQSYRGSRFYVQPAGTADRTTRVAVKASRNDLTSAEDANLTDQIALSVQVTPRYTVIPRP